MPSAHDPVVALGLFAEAMGAGDAGPSAPSDASRPTTRWRGHDARADAFVARAGATHRESRLQVLRRVLDRVPGGRWCVAVAPQDDTGLLGPRREPAEAGTAALGIDDCLRSWPHPVLLRRLFLHVDGRRVDAQLAERFPGAARDLALDLAPPLPDALDAFSRALAAPTDAVDALRVALALHRHLLSRRRRATSPGDAARRTLVVRTGDAPSPDLGDGPSTGGHRLADPGTAGDPVDASATGAADGAADATRTLRAPSRTSPTPRPSPTPAAGPGGIRAATADPTTPDAGAPVRVGAARPVEAVEITRHDEWDCHRRAYLRRWTSVRERRVVGHDDGFLAALHARHPALARRIRQQFARLRADAPRRERRLPDGELVDLDAAIDALADRRRNGGAADDRTYQSRPRRRRDVSVALLLDMSGSTGYPVPRREPIAAPAAAPVGASVEPDPDEPAFLWQPAPAPAHDGDAPVRKVIDVAKEAVGLLGEALQALGDRHAIFAFSGEGRHAVDVAVVRDFDDARPGAWGAALAAIEPQGSTRTGAAVRHALHRLRAQPARRRILIVLSDGYPQDSDYGPDRDDREYGLQDTAHALREAERAGVATFNLSIDAGSTDYLRRMCPPKRYWVVDDVEALPARMLSLYRLLAGSG
ncbi:MAG: nitric oxide reductase activation protein NorD [Lautropia sp.]